MVSPGQRPLRNAAGRHYVAAGVLWAGTLVWVILAAVWATWTPIQLTERINVPVVMPPTTALELIANLLLLAPVGYVVAVRRWPRPVLAGALSGALVSLILEVGQIFLAGRVVSLADLLLNTAGSAAGAFAAVRLTRRTSERRALAMGGLVVLAGFLAFAAITSAILSRTFRISGWDPHFAVVTGDEVGGGKAYQGVVADARICTGAPDRIVCAAAGADAAARVRLVSAAEQSQIVRVHARVVPATNRQWGPARIITFSDGWFHRNITLAQEGSALVLRIRTPLTGPNGTVYEIWTPRTFTPHDTVDISATFDDGRITTELTTSGGRRVARHSLDALAGGLLLRGPGRVTPLQLRVTRGLAVIIICMPLVLAIVDVLTREPHHVSSAAAILVGTGRT